MRKKNGGIDTPEAGVLDNPGVARRYCEIA
jgi:hypothetical protein